VQSRFTDRTRVDALQATRNHDVYQHDPRDIRHRDVKEPSHKQIISL
jgi:hypothetical protein